MEHDCRVHSGHSVWGTYILFRRVTANVRRFVNIYFFNFVDGLDLAKYSTVMVTVRVAELLRTPISK